MSDLIREGTISGDGAVQMPEEDNRRRIIEAYYGSEPQSRRLVLLVGDQSGHQLINVDLLDMQEWFAANYPEALVTDAGGTGSEVNLTAIPEDVLGSYLANRKSGKPSPFAGLEIGCLVDPSMFAYGHISPNWEPGSAVVDGDGNVRRI